MTGPTASELQQLVDKQAIAEVLYRYCHACDRQDAAALRDCFHPDAQHDHGGYVGPTEQWIPLALDWLKGRIGITHMVLNPLIFVDGDRAVSDCHFLACNRVVKEGGGMENVVVKGRYLDCHIRYRGHWQILRRIGIHDMEFFAETASVPEPSPASHRSGPSAEDPFSRLLAAFMAGQ